MQLQRSGNGDPTLEIVDATQPGFALKAAEIFHRDGFVAVHPSMDPAQVSALRSKALSVGAEIVAMDRHGGQKGVGRFMFGGPCSFSRSQVRRTRQVGPEVGPTSASYSCIITGMHGSTCIFWANLIPFSLQMHEREFAMMADLPVVDSVLAQIWGSDSPGR